MGDSSTEGGVGEGPFWERAETVEAFAGRAPDQRLLDLLADYSDPQHTRVLDLGCAGGRNTVVLAERGFDVHALDTSSAMVEHTRCRVAALLGPDEAARRVRVGRMDDLRAFESASVELVVALGVYHNAQSRHEWDRALAEAARVLKSHGRLLVANFSPRSDPTGRGLRRLPGQGHRYEGFTSGPLFLVEPDQLDVEMSRHGLNPEVRTETVTTPTDSGYRVTVNGLYQKAAAAPQRR